MITCLEKSKIFVLSHKIKIDDMYSNSIDKNISIKAELFQHTKRTIKTKNRLKRKTSTFIDEEHKFEEMVKVISYLRETAKKYKKSKTFLYEGISNELTNEPNIINFGDQFTIPKLKGENNQNTSIIHKIKDYEFIIPPKCRFFNYDIENLSNILKDEIFDFILVDPPWRNKYVRRSKTAGNNFSYSFMKNDAITSIPIHQFIDIKSIVVLWCTNSLSHIKSVIDEILPNWKLKLLSQWYWLKLNNAGETICEFHAPGQKQPFEQLFVACHEDNTDLQNTFLKNSAVILSVSSIINSHKPPIIDLFRSFLPDEPKCLELFARCLHSNFTSVGLEVLKLQETRLYNIENKNFDDIEKKNNHELDV